MRPLKRKSVKPVMNAGCFYFLPAAEEGTHMQSLCSGKAASPLEARKYAPMRSLKLNAMCRLLSGGRSDC